MKRQHKEIEQLRNDHAGAVGKADMWRNRAAVAQNEGRNADATRCQDKARDWASRARQIERRRQER